MNHALFSKLVIGISFGFFLLFSIDSKVAFSQQGSLGFWEAAMGDKQNAALYETVKNLVITFGVAAGLGVLGIIFFKRRKKRNITS